MPIELKIPEVGESITDVQISEWLKSEGDQVKADEAVAVIDSEKTTFELPASKGGRLAKILHPAGATVKVGGVIAQIEPDGETKEAPKPKSDPKAGAKTETRRAEATVTKREQGEKEVKEDEKEGRGVTSRKGNHGPAFHKASSPTTTYRRSCRWDAE